MRIPFSLLEFAASPFNVDEKSRLVDGMVHQILAKVVNCSGSGSHHINWPVSVKAEHVAY